MTQNQPPGTKRAIAMACLQERALSRAVAAAGLRLTAIAGTRGSSPSLQGVVENDIISPVKTGRRRAIMKRLSGGRLARLVFAGMTMTGLTIAGLTPARADVLVQIDKSSQRMAVSVDGTMRYEWAVSTGRNGYGTPSGTFHPQSMARHYFSRKYYNAPMPHAIFFHYGFAIHGTNDLARLGGPASHGCVRLHPSHAAALFALVERNGPRHTRIEISN
jgi:lipoprotein-anchoring transpeptidase ErfK/SrfK